MPKFPVLLFLAFFSREIIYAQQVLNENFNAGMPAAWTQTPASSWSLNPSLGTGTSNCIITEELSTTASTNVIRTATVNLSGISNPTVTFKGATTKSNFIAPNIALYYESSAGKVFAARWGSGFTPNTTYTITDAFDPTPPLDAQNVNWINCSHTIAPVTATLSLIFEAEMVNAGYVLLDDIIVTGKPSNPVALHVQLPPMDLKVFPVPAKDEVYIEGEFERPLLINLMGEVQQVEVLHEPGRTIMLVSALPRGIYLLEAEEGAFLKKILLE